jgi:hypothetical protein
VDRDVVLDAVELGRDDHRVVLFEQFLGLGLVIVVALVLVAVAMLAAVHVAAAAFEAGQANLLPAREATVHVLLHLPRRRHLLLVLSGNGTWRSGRGDKRERWWRRGLWRGQGRRAGRRTCEGRARRDRKQRRGWRRRRNRIRCARRLRVVPEALTAHVHGRGGAEKAAALGAVNLCGCALQRLVVVCHDAGEWRAAGGKVGNWLGAGETKM